MSLLVTLNGSNYIIPETNEVGWGSNLDDYFVAIAAGVLQKTGGSFTLSAETDFGASYGLKSLYLKSRSSNVAAAGIVRLANNSDSISWRNAANGADLALLVNASNQLTFNGTPIVTNSLTSAHIFVGNGSGVATDVAVTGDIGIDNAGLTSISSGVIVNADVNASAAIAYSKLNLTGSIVNADVNASAAIAYSKLSLTGGIVNADVNASAAIAYSKLNLGTSIVNADVSGSAAIAYSKLSLTGSVVNADIAAAAAIAVTKIALGTANQVIGTNAGATANEFKTLTSTANQVTVTHGVGTVTFSTPQDIGTSSAVQHGSLALGGSLNASSILSLTSTTKGFLPPVMTTTQKNAISSPTNGLVVFDSDLAQLYLRTGGAWTPLSTGGGSGTVGSGNQYQLAYYAANGTTVGGLTLITGSRALVSDANGLPVAATTTAVELGYVNGVTSAIQTQLNLKAPLASPTFTGTVNAADLSVNASSAGNVTSLVNNTANTGSAHARFVAEVGGTSGGDPITQYSIDGGTNWTVGADNSDGDKFKVSNSTALGTTDAIIVLPTSLKVGIGGSPTVELDVTQSKGGGTLFAAVRNSSNTASSNASLYLEVGGASAGDPYVEWYTSGANAWYMGADNSVSSNMVIGYSSAAIPGSADSLVIKASNGAVAIKGTNSNDAATTGFVGEVVSSTANGVTLPTTTQYGDLTSISLTAGDWLVSADMGLTGASMAVTQMNVGISSTSGNSNTGLTTGDNYATAQLTSGTSTSLSITNFHVQLTGTTTYYLKMRGVFAGGTQAYNGRITAVRIR